MAELFSPLFNRIAGIRHTHAIGRISAISSGVVTVRGLSGCAAMGDRVGIAQSDAFGEVIGLGPGSVTILAEAGAGGMSIGTEVHLLGASSLAPDDSWIGRIIDPLGRALDGAPLFPGDKSRHLLCAAPPAAQRGRLGRRLSTGTACFDTFLPVVRGQRLGLFAGSGVGKSTLLSQFARHMAADVVVIALVGERGRELREFIEVTLGEAGLARSIVVAATSDTSALLRRQCMLSAMTIAEHFRDQGREVLLLADSVTRFAEAHREIALAAGEQPSLRGYPPSVQTAIMSLAERAGPGSAGQGNITAIFSVLVPASDMDEPIADILRGVLDGHVVMDRKIAERGRFPAIDLLRSVSRSLPCAASASENELISQARRLVATWENAEMMIQAGLYQKGTDRLIDLAIERWPAIDDFIGQSTPGVTIEDNFARLAEILAPRQGR